MCSSSKETLLGSACASEEEEHDTDGKDKKIFLFRKEANEADEGKEVIFKRSKKNLKISVSIQLKKPYSTFIKPYTKDE